MYYFTSLPATREGSSLFLKLFYSGITGVYMDVEGWIVQVLEGFFEKAGSPEPFLLSSWLPPEFLVNECPLWVPSPGLQGHRSMASQSFRMNTWGCLPSVF